MSRVTAASVVKPNTAPSTFAVFHHLLSQCAILLLYDILKPESFTSTDSSPSTQLNIQPWMFLTWIHPYFHEKQLEYMFGNSHFMVYDAYLYENGMRNELRTMRRDTRKSSKRDATIGAIQDDADVYEHQDEVDHMMYALRLSQEHVFEEVYGSEWVDIEQIFSEGGSGITSSRDPLIHLMYAYAVSHVQFLMLVLLNETEMRRKEVEEYNAIMRKASYLFYIVTRKRRRMNTLRQKCIARRKLAQKHSLSLVLLKIYLEKVYLPAKQQYEYWERILGHFLIGFTEFADRFHNYTNGRLSKQGQTKDSLRNEIMMWLSKQQDQTSKRRQKRLRRKRPRYLDLHIMTEEVAQRVIDLRSHIESGEEHEPSNKSVHNTVVNSFLNPPAADAQQGGASESKL